jgi:hypothetical protein
MDGHRRQVLAAPFACLLALVIAACGSSSVTPGSTAPSPGGPAASSGTSASSDRSGVGAASAPAQDTIGSTSTGSSALGMPAVSGVIATQPPTPVPQAMITYGVGAAYTPALATWFNANCKSGDVMIALAMSDLNNVHCGSRQLLFNSEVAAETTLAALAAAGDLPDTVGYDFEHRSATPTAEQIDPVTYAQKFRALAAKYHFKLLFAPDRTYGQQMAGTVAGYFDAWAFQLQQFDGSSQLFTYADPIFDTIRSANPSIRVSMQFRPTVTSAQIKTIVDQFAAAGRRPDVVSLLYTDPVQVIDLSSALRP